MEKVKSIYIALGSNIDDREEYLKSAISLISGIEETCVAEVSHIYETAPVGYVEQGNFLNMAVRVRTRHSPLTLLRKLQEIEKSLNRVRNIRWGPRTIDLDILMYEDRDIRSEELNVPHPRMRERAFVLVPLLDVLDRDDKRYKDFTKASKLCGDYNDVKLYKKWEQGFGNIKINISEVGSTNDYLKEKALIGAKSGTVVISKKQISGKGRLGRVWDSMNEDGIWISILIRPDTFIGEISNITQIFAVSVAETLRGFLDIKCGIKWPNDIILDNKKVCGILCEANFSGEDCNFIVVGIGINVNQDGFQEDLSNIAISLKMYSGIVYDKQEIINKLIEISDKYYSNFCVKKSEFFKEYIKYSVTIGHKVRVIKNDVEKESYAQDINDRGNLVLKNSDGSIEEITSGEVSVRGLYNV